MLHRRGRVEFKWRKSKGLERRGRSGKRFEALDVTRAMLARPDGYPDLTGITNG